MSRSSPHHDPRRHAERSQRPMRHYPHRFIGLYSRRLQPESVDCPLDPRHRRTRTSGRRDIHATNTVERWRCSGRSVSVVDWCRIPVSRASGEMADAGDLKSLPGNPGCGFDSRLAQLVCGCDAVAQQMGRLWYWLKRVCATAPKDDVCPFGRGEEHGYR